MTLLPRAKLRANDSFRRALSRLDEHSWRRVRDHLREIRAGRAELTPSLIRPDLVHFFTDDYVIVLVVSHDRSTAVAAALLAQTGDDL